MLKYVLGPIGWLLLLITGLSIYIKIFGSDDAVIRYANASRNADVMFLGLAIALIFLGISSILWKLEELDERLDNLDSK